MFFKKRETDIDDDFDDDNFDDFDLDGGGFDDTTPKTGLRKAVSTVTGGFFSGLKSEVLDSNVHRKILKESMPDGYVAHYDDAKDALREAKSIYDTAADETRKLKKEYANEMRPAVEQWNKNSNSKMSNRAARALGAGQERDDGGPQLSEGEMAFNNSANDIFGMSMAQQTSDGIAGLSQHTQESSTISQGLQNQTNTILTNVSNTLSQQNAFNEQIALKLSKKKLEIQFKQYFTARKQLEVQIQTNDYIQATLPNIVKNTSLPDIVKTQTSELAGQMLSEKWIGSISGKAHESISEVMGKAGVNIKSLISEKMQAATGQSNMLGSALGMFDTESGFGQSPKDMLLEAGGGFAASQLIDFIVSKSTESLKERADASDIDFEKGSEGAKQLKLQLPAIIASLTRNGTGVEALDKLLEMSGLDRLADGRSTVIQSTMGGDKLASQAIFNLETQKSITYTIPALLSEIHGELRSVRFSVGGDDPDPDGKLRMDWTSGQLNTSKRIRTNLEEKMYTKNKADEASEVVYKMLGKLGFKEDDIRKDKEVLDKDGNVVLDSKDLNYLAAAVKTASYDPTKFFDIEDLANGSSLIRDTDSRMKVAAFFTNQLDIEGEIDTQNGTIDIVTAKRNYFANKSALKIKQQNIIDEARIDAGAQGVGDDIIKNAVREGNVTDLINQGIVTVDKDGNYTFDAQAHAERLMFAEESKIRTPEDLFGIKTNNKYGAENRNRERIQREAEQTAREKEKKDAKEKAAKDKQDARDAEDGTKFGKAWRHAKEDAVAAKEAAKKAKEQMGDVVRGDSTIILPEDISAANAEESKSNDIGEILRNKRNRIPESTKRNYQSQSKIVKEAQEQKRRDEENALNAGKEASVIILGHVKDTVDTFIEGLTSGTTEVRAGIKPINDETDFDTGISKLTQLKPTKPPTLPNEDGRYVVTKRQKPSQMPMAGDKDDYNIDLGMTDTQAREMVTAAMTVFNRMYGMYAPGNNFVPNSGSMFTSIKDKSNFFTGGRIGRFSSLIKNFAKGGRVDFNGKYNKILDKLLPKPSNVPDFGFNQNTQVNDVLGPIKSAMDKETAAGGKPQVIVASEDEQVLSTANGDAQAFRDFQKSGVWAKMKSHKEIYENFNNNGEARPGKIMEDEAAWWNYNSEVVHSSNPKGTNSYDDFSAQKFTPANGPAFKPFINPKEDNSITGLAKTLISEVRKVSAEKTEGIRGDFKKASAEWKSDNGDEISGIGGDEHSVKVHLKNVTSEAKKKAAEVKDKLSDPEAMEGIGPIGAIGKLTTGIDKVKGLDSEETRAAVMGKLLGVKDFGTDKLKMFSDMFDSEGEGSGVNMPKFSFGNKDKAVSTISHQIAELIRLTGHVALNTGSTAEDLTPEDADLISPYTGGRGLSFNKDGGFFKSIKDRFKRKDKMEGVGEEEGESRWGRLKNKFKRKPDNELDEIMSDEEIDESTPDGKKKGLIRRMLGGMFGLSWGTTKLAAKATMWATKKSAMATWWATKKASVAASWGFNGLFGGTDESHDVYLEGVKRPVMLARDMAEGKYLSAEDGEPILKASDVKGAVLDLKGNYVITEDDYNNRRVVIHTTEGTQSLFVRAVKGAADLSGTIMGGGLKASWAIIKMPFKVLSYKFDEALDNDKLSSDSKIDKDIYVKGEGDEPIIRAKLIGKGEYWTNDRNSVETYDQIKDGVYDKTGNLILGPAELKKGLYTPDGNVLTKVLGATGSVLGAGVSMAYKTSSAAFSLGGKILRGTGSLLGKLTGGAFSLATGAGKGLWNALKGGAKDFDIDGVDKYALLLQAQAAGVDKLEMIRVILDERMEDKNKKFNDKDGDGERDGSYMDQLRKKLEAKKEKDAEKKRAKKEKMDGIDAANEKKSMFAGLTESVTSGISGFFSKGLMFAALGGLVAANFGPQIATGIFSGIRSVLPRWLGGYSQEKKDEIAANGGVIKHMMSTGAAAAEDKDGNRISTQPQVDENGNPLPPQMDENGNPIPTEEGTGGSGLSTTSKFMIGAGATMLAPTAVRAAGRGILKTPGLLATGARLASNKVGLTARLGMSGMGKATAVKHIATKAGGLVKGAGRLLVNPAARTAAMTAGRTMLTGALPALASLAVTPIGLGILAAVAIGVTVYAGYKLYKHLTKEDNHLVTFRMAQYGYKIGNKDMVTKILDLEQYLGKFTAKASASTSAKISTQADTKEVLKIFGVSQSVQEDIDKFMNWYYYRFKPVYLTWKTLFARSSGKDTIEDVDKLLLMEDKVKMVGDADFARTELNPYDTMSSPLPGSEEVDLNHADVLEVRTKVLAKLGKIDVVKHDTRVRGLGGGSKGDGSRGASIENMTASPETPAESKDRRMKEEKKKENEAKAERKRIEKAVRAKEGADQSFISKLLNGDKTKDPSGPFSWGVSAGKKVRSAIAGFFGGGGDGGEGGTYDASSKTLNLSEQDIKDITKVTSTEAAEHLGQAEYNRQAGAIVDTIINRVISKGYPDTVRGVINQKSQFSAISGNKGAYGSIQAMPDSAVKAKAGAFVPGYLRGRVDGTVKPVINGDLNYLNPAHSGQKALRTWGKIIMDQANSSGQIYGSKGSLHYHGTSTEMLNKKPFGFKLAIGGKSSPAQGAAKGEKVKAPKGQVSQGESGKSASTYSVGTAGRKPAAASGGGRVAPGTGPLMPTSGAKATSVDLSMKSVTSKPGAGSTATGPSTWTKVKNFHSDLSNALSGAPSAAPVTMKDGTKKNWTPAKKAADAASAEPKASKADGNLVAPEMTTSARPAKAVAYAMKHKVSDSTGYCLRYVRKALQHAGYPNMGGGIVSAYMYATTGHLAKNGFKEIPANSPPQLGDVGVTSAPRGKIHGHIAIYNGTKWVSDFVHDYANPYSDKSLKGWLYRDAQFLDGAPAYPGDEASGGSSGIGAIPYRMDAQATLDKIKAKREKREELAAKSQLKEYKSQEIKLEFSGGRGKQSIKDTKADKDTGHYKMGGFKDIFNLPKSDIISYDNTPSGYIPKERVSKVVQIEDNGAVGNTIKAKRTAEEIRLEHEKGEAGRLTAANNAQRLREVAEKQNQAQLKRIEVARAAEVTSATEQKVVQEKQQQIAETDSGIYKQQLEVQISMAKDIRRMAETLDKMYALPPGNTNNPTATNAVEQKPVPAAEMNTHTRTVAKDEPVSMKIR